MSEAVRNVFVTKLNKFVEALNSYVTKVWTVRVTYELSFQGMRIFQRVAYTHPTHRKRNSDALKTSPSGAKCL